MKLRIQFFSDNNRRPQGPALRAVARLLHIQERLSY